MKIIIAKKYLQKSLKKVLKKRCQKLTISKEEFEFNCNGELLLVNGFHIRDGIEESYKVDFDYFQWRKVYKYLKLIRQEQPIVVEIEGFEYDSLRIEITGVHAVF